VPTRRAPHHHNAAKHTGVVDAFTTALAMAGDQCVLAGTGAVQRACHPQACLVETGHLGLGDALCDQLEELI
jgi:hypothetical protein